MTSPLPQKKWSRMAPFFCTASQVLRLPLNRPICDVLPATPHPSSLRDVVLRALELRAGRVAVLRQILQLAVIRGGLLLVACGLGGARGAIVPAEAVRLADVRSFVLLQRLRRLTDFEQHIAEQLARGHDPARRDDVLLVLVLEIGGGA